MTASRSSASRMKHHKAVGLPTDAWLAKAAGQFICNAATERTDPMCWSR